MNQENTVLDALEMVMAWELPDEYLANTLFDQARMRAGADPEETWDCPLEYPFS
jgi:hypothetical protein